MKVFEVRAGALAAVALLLVSGCGLVGSVPQRPAAVSANFTVTSPAFRDGAWIPARYTCRGDRMNPPLRWFGVPAATRSLALVVDDPDAPSGTYVHWIVFDIGPQFRELAEDSVPPGAREARNSAGTTSYIPLCPPKGTVHHYRFTVYALDAPLDLPDGATLNQIVDAIPAHVIAMGRLTGVFGS